MVIDWCDDFLIGFDDLDHDHKVLIHGLNRIAEVLHARRDEPLSLLEDWLAVFARHTRKEELLLDRLRHPGGIQHRDEHNAGHRRFLGHVHTFRAQVAAGAASTEAIARLGLFLAADELIRADYEMIGHLRREGLLLPDGSLRAAE